MRHVIAVGIAVAACLGPAARASQAQQPLRIEGIYPRQLPPGQTTVVNLVIPSVDDIQAEVSPAQGATVSRVTQGDVFQGSHRWWDLTIDLAADAAPGERTLTVRLPGGRSASTHVIVPSHVPRIADLRLVALRDSPGALDLEMTATDRSGDLGPTPHVWFMAACGDMPLPGVVRGVMAAGGNGGVVRATVPRPVAGRAAGAAASCTLQVRVADAHGFESNELRTTFDATKAFGQPPAAPAPATRGAADSGEWTEIVSQEERLSFNIPGTPTISHVMWPSQYGAVLPARVYNLEKGPSRYTATIVDYNPIERLLVERSRSCPAAANTCQGIADWGIGYWKTDIRGAVFYAIAKYIDRDAKMTSLIWNGIALVQGVEMRLTNNADQSRTFSSIYMHENRLVILEGTVPRGAPPPVAFNESLNWLDDKGQPVRYQATYVNIPDVPKPLPRGANVPAPPLTR